MNVKRWPSPQIVGSFAVFKDRATSIWIVRDMKTREEVAHENNQTDALKSARMRSKKD